MTYRQHLYISPATLTDLKVIIKYENTVSPIRIATLDDFNVVDNELHIGFSVLSDCTVTIYSQGYEVKTLNITSEDVEDEHIVLIPTSDYIKTSDGTNDYYVKDTYSRQFENDLLDIVMTKADSSDISNFANKDLSNLSATGQNIADTVKDQNTNTRLKYWTGTKNEYDELGNNYYAWKFNTFTVYSKSLSLTNTTKIYDNNGNATSQKCSSFYGWSFQSSQVYTQTTNPQIGDYIAYDNDGGTTFSLSTSEIISVTPTTITVDNLTYTRDTSLDTIQSDTVGYISDTSTTSVYRKYTRDTSLDFTLGDTQYNNNTIYICTDTGNIYKGNNLISGANRDLSNLSTTGKMVIDGQFISDYQIVLNDATLNGSSGYQYDVSNILPDDNYIYEVTFTVGGSTGAATGNGMYIWVGSDIIGAGTTTSVGKMQVVRIRSQANSAQYGVAEFKIPIGTERKLYLYLTNAAAISGVALVMYGYRRIGTNQ